MTAFEKWWKSEGQYVRAGGGDYEKSFAFAAWNHTAKNAPAWHDAPTCEGLWALDDGTTCQIMPGASLRFDADEGTRWYGPIPEDKP